MEIVPEKQQHCPVAQSTSLAILPVVPIFCALWCASSDKAQQSGVGGSFGPALVAHITPIACAFIRAGQVPWERRKLHALTDVLIDGLTELS